MFLKKRILVSVAAVWLTALLVVATVVITATATAANGGKVLEDVQFGERGALSRIAIICSGGCKLETDESGEFLLRGVSTAVKIDLSKRSQYVRSFSTKPVANGARINIVASEAVARVENKICQIGSKEAMCIDLHFDPQVAAKSKSTERVAASVADWTAPTPSPKPAKSMRMAAKSEPAPAAEPAPREERPGQSIADLVRQAAAPQGAVSNARARPVSVSAPALRESSTDRYLVFANLAPPERLTAPTGAILAKVTPIEASVDVGKPAVSVNVTGLAEPLAREFNFAKDAAFLVGKTLGPGECAAAEHALQEDAWALDAMVDLGYCHAISGDAGKADGIFSRLLQYTPDNYLALVGRALIAAEMGDTVVARGFFQDALNALPPVEESNRIVDAMAAL